MVVFYFPDDKEFANIVCYSPIDHITCNRKPFGDINAEEYFDYAKRDLNRGDDSVLINALSHAKRCFHYQIDRILYRYSLRQAASSMNFPEKLNLLSELNVFPLHC
jgi:hypothetical protein